MQTLIVVELEVAKRPWFQVWGARIVVEVDVLIFDRTPQALDG